MLKLNLACATNMFPGWVNLDLFDMSGYLQTLRTTGDISTWPEHQQKIAAHARDNRVTCGVWDLGQGLPQYADGTADAIYSGQFLEHIHALNGAPAFLSECWRVLKPGAALKLTTPDLDMLIDAYKSGEMDKFQTEQPDYYMKVTPDAQLSFLLFGATGPNCLRSNFEGHWHIYGRRNMTALLDVIGFTDIRYDGFDPIFDETVDCGMTHSMAVQARKP